MSLPGRAHTLQIRYHIIWTVSGQLNESIVSDYSCPVCGIDFINKLEKDEKYKYFFKSSFEIISYPKYIIFLFDMEVSDNSLINYENLK